MSSTIHSALLNAAVAVIAWLFTFALFLLLCGLASCRTQRHVEAQGFNISEVASAQIGARRTALLAASFPLQLPVNLFRDTTQKDSQTSTAVGQPNWVLAVEETSSTATQDYAGQHQTQRVQHTPASSLRLIDYVCFAAGLLGVVIAAICHLRRHP